MAFKTRQLADSNSTQHNCRAEAPACLSSQGLVERWQQGDHAAAAELYERYVAQVRDVVRFHLNPRFSARCSEEDAVQIIFMEAFRRLAKGQCVFESDAGFQRWIRAVARNRTIKLIKHQTAEKRAVGRESRSEDSEALLNMVDRRRPSTDRCGAHVGIYDLQERIDLLDDQSRQIVALLASLCTQDTIARRLGCTTRTVRRRVRKIREVLVETL